MAKMPYSLSRPGGGRKTWRYKLDGMSCYKSTGKKTKRDADEYVRKLLSGDLPKDEENLSLREATKDMFIRSRCRWMKRKEQRGRPVSPEMEQQRRSHMENHIWPKFGSRVASTIRKIELEDWLLAVDRRASTKNHILGTLRIMWAELVDRQIVDQDITVNLETFKDQPERKAVLDPKTLAELFPRSAAARDKIWTDPKWSALFTIFATTGIRLGEASALRWSDWQTTKEGAPYLVIDKAAKNDRRIGTTKSGKERVVLLVTIAVEALEHWRALSPWSGDDDLIFPNNSGEVLQRGVVANAFARVMNAQGVSVADGKLSPHSLRHTYNTLMRRKIDDRVLRQFTGHQSEQMTDYYDHSSIHELAEYLGEHSGDVTTIWDGVFSSAAS